MVAKRSARSERTQAINQARALIVTGPEDLRARFAAHATADLVAELAALRPRPGAVVGYHTRIALRELGRRAEFLDSQIERLDALIGPLVTGHAPGLLAWHGVGADTAAMLLVAAGDHPERLRSEAAWAHLCAVAPIPASSGKTARRRLNPAGDRQANHAPWRIVRRVRNPDWPLDLLLNVQLICAVLSGAAGGTAGRTTFTPCRARRPPFRSNGRARRGSSESPGAWGRGPARARAAAGRAGPRAAAGSPPAQPARLRTRSREQKDSRSALSTRDLQLIAMITGSQPCRGALEGHFLGSIILG